MSDIRKVIKDIQEEINDRIDLNDTFFLAYTEAGYTESVGLDILLWDMNIKIDLWNSENDSRKFIEETNDYEEFRIFLKRQVVEAINSLAKLKLVIDATISGTPKED